MNALVSALLDVRRLPSAQGELLLGRIDSVDSWSLLEPHWQAVHEATPGASVFQTYDYLRTWWQCLGSAGELLIVLVMRGNQLLAIAPLQVTGVKQLGRPVPTISFIGQPSESDRPTLLGEPAPEVCEALAEYLLTLKHRWQSIVLFEQPVDSTLVRVLRERLQRARYLTAQIDGNECPYIEIKGTWNDYLAGRNKAFRKSLKRRRTQLEGMGALRCETVESGDIEGAMRRFRAVEDKSWKRAQNLGIGRSPRHWHFHEELARRSQTAGMLRFCFLTLDGVDIAATFGLLWRRRFYSLHVAHDAAQVDTSPGVVLTALELEPLFAGGQCDVYDFLGGFLSNKRSWSSGSQFTTALFGDRPRPRGLAFHLVYFKLKPLVRKLLSKAGAMERVTHALHKFRRSRTPPPVE